MKVQFDDVNLWRVGLYTVGDVARYSGVRPRRIYRWFRGYKGRNRRRYEPIWHPEVPTLEGRIGFSFNDLMEIRFVNLFLELEIPLKRIRKAVNELQRTLDTPHPFSTEIIVTDGQQLFQNLQDTDGKQILYELSGSRLFAMHEVIMQFGRGLYWDRGLVQRWTPEPERANRIVMDPAFCFGHPTVTGTRIQAWVLADDYEVKGSYERVAEWYKIDPISVQHAVVFQQRFGG